MNADHAIAAMAHHYAASQVSDGTLNELPPSLLDHVNSLNGWQRVELFHEATKRATRIMADFRLSHQRAALLLAGDRGAVTPTAENPRQTWQTGALQ